jgi:hypothetical protein
MQSPPPVSKQRSSPQTLYDYQYKTGLQVSLVDSPPVHLIECMKDFIAGLDLSQRQHMFGMLHEALYGHQLHPEASQTNLRAPPASYVTQNGGKTILPFNNCAHQGMVIYHTCPACTILNQAAADFTYQVQNQHNKRSRNEE